MENLTTELDKMIELCAQNVMYPPPRGHGMHQKYNQAEAKAAWKLQMSSVKSLVTKIRQDGDNNEADQVSSIMKVLKIKDDILAQTFAAMTYKKTLIWTDLKIMPGSAKNADTNDEIYTSEKIAEIHEKIEEY